ncbi:N-6 DNA methylase [Nocardia fluminea]|uniref:N-6 DNA methylase n=1 Tax=Nocardia fluminea TaxID=134984 RepID=UPI00340D742E
MSELSQQPGERMTAHELASAIDIDVSSIANWRRRHPDFPKGIVQNRSQTYDVNDLTIWLDPRRVPHPRWHAGETADASYGRRLRHHLAARQVVTAPREGGERHAQAVRELTSLAKRSFPGLQPAQVLDAALSLTFIWVMDIDAWNDIEASAGQIGTVIRVADGVARRYGLAPMGDGVFRNLSRSRVDDIGRLVRISSQLGKPGFQTVSHLVADAVGTAASNYRTPQEVSALIAACALPVTGRVASIADLYCRHGEMAVAAVDSAVPHSPSVQVFGPDSAAIQRVRMRLVMSGLRHDALVTDSDPWQRRSTTTFDAVVVNPPFNQMLSGDSASWEYGNPPEHRANLAWAQAALAATSSRGKAAILMPVSAAASGDNSEIAIREALVDRGAVRAVIRLSGDLFPNSSADAMIWVLQHPQIRRDENQIVFVDATGFKSKTSERERPRLTDPSAIADLVREPHNLTPEVPREVNRTGAVSPARFVVVSANVVADHDYALTPHTYLRDSRVGGNTALSHVEDHDRDSSSALRRLNGIAPTTAAVRGLADEWPDGWKRRPLGELCDIKSGTSRLTRSKLNRSENARVPVLRPGNVKARRIVTDDIDHTTDDTAARFDAYRLRQNDLLVVRVGQVQDIALVPDMMHDHALYDSNLTRLRIKINDEGLPAIDPRYLLEFLLSRATTARIRATASAHIAPTISAAALADLTVPIPSLAEQQSVVTALVDRESRIESLRAALHAEENARDMLADGLLGGELAMDEGSNPRDGSDKD